MLSKQQDLPSDLTPSEAYTPPSSRKPAATVAPSGDERREAENRHCIDGHSDRVRPFQSILFPPGLEHLREERTDQPGCFTDLNLDQVIARVIARRDKEALRPLFYSTYRNVEIVTYRQAVFSDLENPAVAATIAAFTDGMRAVRGDLNYATEIRIPNHRRMVMLRAAARYYTTVTTLLRGLRAVNLRSSGLRELKEFLDTYTASVSFVTLATETSAIQAKLSNIRYGMLFRGDKVTVRKHEAEPDYAIKVLNRFARFRDEDNGPVPSNSSDDYGLNHVEQAILEFVAQLFPGTYNLLKNYVLQHEAFINETLALFHKEIEFYTSFLATIEPLRQAGMQFCYPAVSATVKDTAVVQGFDLALASKCLAEQRPIVCNDFHLTGPERMLVVSGPNQGGKTTFARMFGQLHILAGLGCPVPGQAAKLFLADQIFTHFERAEEITNLRSKLEDELIRLRKTCLTMTSDSVVVLNEILNATALEDQIFLCTRILETILATDALAVCVTFLDGLASLNEKTVSMVSTVVVEDPAKRTFQVIRKPADGLAYARALAERRGVTYEQLRARIKP